MSNEINRLDFSPLARQLIQRESEQATKQPPSRKPEPRLSAPVRPRRTMPRGCEGAIASEVPPAIIQSVRSSIGFKRWPLYLFGPAGAGKTCAAALVYANWNASAVWYSLTELCDLLSGFLSSPTQIVYRGGQPVEVSRTGFWRQLENASLVVCDEIGTREATAHRYDALLRLLDCRVGKPLILTSNLDEVALERAYDERILSRIVAGIMVNVKGRDRRMDGMEDRQIVVE